MSELSWAPDQLEVHPAEYVRLLGYPRGHVLEGRALELADWAREWYRGHGRPWTFAHSVCTLGIGAAEVQVNGTRFTSPKLAETFRAAGAEAAVLVAVSAGAELEIEAQRRWQDGKPDEYFFLEVYGSAVVEHLITITGARLCAQAEIRGEAMLPHYSPGYPDWDVSDQPALLRLLKGSGGAGATLPLRAFESGMLQPKKSLLAIFGITQHVDRAGHLAGLHPCERCSFAPCQFRRAPYRRSSGSANPELAHLGAGDAESSPEDERPSVVAPLSPQAKYSVNERALRRWAAERLTIFRADDGGIDARFRFDGTTCTNMGRPMAFHYQVRLGPPEAGYRILEERCTPAPGDQGYLSMCGYLDHSDRLMKAIDDERPLQGEPLESVLAWRRPQASAGCYCEAESRTHKWGLVLETLHYALARGAGPSAAVSGPSPRETAS